MSDRAATTGDTDMHEALQRELLLLRRRLAQRELALAELNRRLGELERRAPDKELLDRVLEAGRRARAAEEELVAMRETKTFRYTERARQLYGRSVRRLVRR